jgi:hypothetical protein
MERRVATSLLGLQNLYVLFALLFLSGVAMGQVSPGTPSFSAYDAHEVDTVNLLNNNVTLNVPVMSKSGAFPFRFGLAGNYYIANVGGTWRPSAALAGSQLQGAANGFIGLDTGSNASAFATVSCPGGVQLLSIAVGS